MCLKIAGTMLVVAMLAVLLANQNDAADGQAEAGDGTSQDAAVVAVDPGEPEPKLDPKPDPKPDPLDEIQRLKETLQDMKTHVALKLRSSQGLGHSEVVIAGKISDNSHHIHFLPRMSREED